jgi:hypothetical protein
VVLVLLPRFCPYGTLKLQRSDILVEIRIIKTLSPIGARYLKNTGANLPYSPKTEVNIFFKHPTSDFKLKR